jgi:hypothetical protein
MRYVSLATLFFFAILSQVANATDVPKSCQDPSSRQQIQNFIEFSDGFNPSSPVVTKMDVPADIPRHVAFPSVGSHQELYQLECPVIVTWSDGTHEWGTMHMMDRYNLDWSVDTVAWYEIRVRR